MHHDDDEGPQQCTVLSQKLFGIESPDGPNGWAMIIVRELHWAIVAIIELKEPSFGIFHSLLCLMSTSPK